MTIEKTAESKSLVFALALFACAPTSAWPQTQTAASRVGGGVSLRGGVGSIGAPTPTISAMPAPASLPILSLTSPALTAPVTVQTAGVAPLLAQAIDTANNIGSSAQFDERFDAVRALSIVPAPTLNAAQPAASAEAFPDSRVPSWFDASGLAFVLLSKAEDGYTVAVLRRGRFELGVFLDAQGVGQAIFTKYALNPMGTPMKEEVELLTAASRRAAAEILRRTQNSGPVSGKEKVVLDGILSVLAR